MIWYGMVWYDMIWYGMICPTVSYNILDTSFYI